MQYSGINLLKHWLKMGLTLCLLVTLAIGLSAAKPVQISRLPAGNAITDGSALLRDALPIDNTAIRDLQESLEDITEKLRSQSRWGAITGDISRATRIATDKQAAILASIPSDRQPGAIALLDQIKAGLPALQTANEAKDRVQVMAERGKVLNLVGQIEELMVQQFPYEVPETYSNLPQLKGRAKVEFTTNKGKIVSVIDGYSAPVTAGNFIDLVQRGFYNGLPFTRAEESYVLQVGDPPGAEVGFVDPQTKQYRAIPLEVKVKADPVPVYGITLEDAGRFREQPVLPFSAYGAMALARPDTDPNGGSSQFFFFLFDSELTPAGANLLDGRYAIFGFVVEGKEVLKELRAGDKIESAKVIEGLDKFQEPASA
ncbi:peptidylprolyl isomerase [Phormidium sp. CLA17]|uniref:peptidylprolyl isomerase n=1 Tax=Leptolyngbya sp. Cla-17 TaxID=2803751 RepID=UPI0014926AF6|nr:peptidylprolyl isomerase [Leptolyngbya sp. Cla-17]MBM0740751.1 peptidylprolyl isomerase [Leptolyngbya sp. Cla-17]